MSIYDIEVTEVNGSTYKLEKYKGKVLLIVNTATKCGLADQFEDLEQLYKKYEKDGLIILGFPSNQFKQETSTGLAAAESCRLTYGVSFPMHELVKVNGKDAHPLFKKLTNDTKGLFGQKVKWNFTKFLVDRDGNVIQRFAPQEKPLKFEEKIKKYL